MYYERDDYDCENWDSDGYPGEYVHGEDVYLDDYYMDEKWKRVDEFPDYWVSNKGRMWSSRSKRFVDGYPGKQGHIDISIRYGDVRFRRLLHRLIAEEFIPNPENYPFVRHLDDDPDNNCIDNLAWGTPLDNVHDCINNGHFKFFTDESRELAMEKRRTPVVAIRFSDGRRFHFESQQEAARVLGMHQSCICDVINGLSYGSKGYYFINEGDPIDVARFKYAKSRHYSPKRLIRGVNLNTGDSVVFNGPTEAAKATGMSVSAVSLVLHGKAKQSKGWYFETMECDE